MRLRSLQLGWPRGKSCWRLRCLTNIVTEAESKWSKLTRDLSNKSHRVQSDGGGGISGASSWISFLLFLLPNVSYSVHPAVRLKEAEWTVTPAEPFLMELRTHPKHNGTNWTPRKSGRKVCLQGHCHPFTFMNAGLRQNVKCKNFTVEEEKVDNPEKKNGTASENHETKLHNGRHVQTLTLLYSQPSLECFSGT